MISASCAIVFTVGLCICAEGDVPSEKDLLAIYNKAQGDQLAGRHEAALKGFLTVKKYYPDDWRTRSKIVQEYSALEKHKQRDAEIRELYDFWSKLPKDRQSEIPSYCREQFTIGKRKVMVFEYFALKGERAIKYSFVVLKKNESKADFRITLGSYDLTTQIARETGAIGDDERLFHLDGYYSDGEHRTYSFFEDPPEYGEVRKMVVEIVKGKRSHISGFKRSKDGTEIEIDIK